jgi:hypothetical integral membrane protein (TIGR02206 family)
MEVLAADHVGAVAVTAVSAGALTGAARTRPGAWTVPASRVLAVVILGTYAIEHATFVVRGTWSLERNLPCHLTDLVTIVASVALWTGRPLLAELTYFWGLSASLQALLTPDLGASFPEIFFWTYYVTHAGAVIAAVFLVFGRDLRPRPGAVGRVFAITAAWAAFVGLVDVATGGNYMFLRDKPGHVSLLDVMGPWPLYLVTGTVLALALFWLLDLPFRRARPATAA